MKREEVRATLWGLLVTLILAGLIVLGSRNLSHLDVALAGYIIATLLATFGITYRSAIWLQRPPTALYWRRGWQAFLDPRYLQPNLVIWARHTVVNIALNRFIFHRGRLRWL